MIGHSTLILDMIKKLKTASIEHRLLKKPCFVEREEVWKKRVTSKVKTLEGRRLIDYVVVTNVKEYDIYCRVFLVNGGTSHC